MRLTVVNFFKKTVPGHIFRGKHRLVKKTTPQSLATLARDFELQEENMGYLLKPYLTLAQSSGHAKALGKEQKLLAFWQRKGLVMKPHVTIAERLGHLNVQNVWD